MNFALKVWRQKNSKTAGSFVDYFDYVILNRLSALRLA